jgi:hypothetical protein
MKYGFGAHFEILEKFICNRSSSCTSMMPISLFEGFGILSAMFAIQAPPGDTDAHIGGTDAHIGGTDAHIGGTDAHIGGTDAHT